MGLTQPLKWHGGKHYLAKHIVRLFPPHLHYVEPFFGGGSVLLHRDPDRDWFANHAADDVHSSEKGCSEVINDIDGELMSFWRVLQDPTLFEQFSRIVAVTPFSQAVWEAAAQPTGDQVERAVRFFIRARQSRQGLRKEFATLSRNRTRRRMNEQASSWLSAVEGLPEIHQRLRSVVILQGSALDVIKKQDGVKTLFYLDPPYLHQTRITTNDYKHEMTEAEHHQLLTLLTKIEGRFLLSGYPSELYESFAKEHYWFRKDVLIDNKASAKKKKDVKTECLWMNYDPESLTNTIED